jgi:hypothetical protein
MIGLINKNKKVSCKNCDWHGLLGDALCAIWISPEYMTPVAMGGDGYNFRCPKCKMKVDEIRYDPPKIRLK